MNTQASVESYDFANILFSGKCNAQCPYCIGTILEKKYPSNLDTYPLPGISSLVDRVRKYAIPEIIHTGTTTDPLLYRHQKLLAEYLRSETPLARRALHTNGFLILRRPEDFHEYTKCTISIPSFQKRIFRIMMGTVQSVPDIATIMRDSDIPIKLSRIVDATNDTLEDTSHYLEYVVRAGVKRVVFRKLLWDLSPWDDTEWYLESLGGVLIRNYRSNPVYAINGVEVTLWSFDHTKSRSINLFSDGVISDDYLLEKNERSTERVVECG